MNIIDKFVIEGNPATKKNSQRLVFVKKLGRSIVLPSETYEKFEKSAGKFIPAKSTPIDFKVEISCVYYMATRRAVDLTNLLEATDDVLVKHKYLKDDNCKIIVSHDGSRVDYDKDNPRTEVTVKRLEEM